MLAEPRQFLWQKHEEAIGKRGHDDQQQRRKQAAHTPPIKAGERKSAVLKFANDDPGDQEAGDHKEDIDPDESAGQPGGEDVADNHQQHGKRAKAIDVRTIGVLHHSRYRHGSGRGE